MEEEIEKVSGIGTVTEAAEKAVEAFGEKTLEELAEENKRKGQTTRLSLKPFLVHT